MRRYKNWAHKITFWKYTSEDLFCRYFLPCLVLSPHPARVPHFCSSLNSSWQVLKISSFSSTYLILVEVDDKCQWQVPMCSWLKLHPYILLWDKEAWDVVCHSVARLCQTLRPHRLQHARLLCPPLSPDVSSSSCPLSQWCHPAISPYAVPFYSCPQSFPASGSFPMSGLYTSGGQSIRASALVSVLPVNFQGCDLL